MPSYALQLYSFFVWQKILASEQEKFEKNISMNFLNFLLLSSCPLGSKLSIFCTSCKAQNQSHGKLNLTKESSKTSDKKI